MATIVVVCLMFVFPVSLYNKFNSQGQVAGLYTESSASAEASSKLAIHEMSEDKTAIIMTVGVIAVATSLILLAVLIHDSLESKENIGNL